MKSKRNTLKILLDTTFILPTLGIDAGSKVEETLRNLRESEAELYYSQFSILESLWVAAKISKSQSFDIERFNQGLRSIIKSGRYIKVKETCKIFEEALKLYMQGHKDIIDNILYATSVNLNLKLLTLDTELKDFILSQRLKNTFISPSQLKPHNPPLSS